jgi:hypothetical protein
MNLNQLIVASILLHFFAAASLHFKTDIPPLSSLDNYPKKKERQSEAINELGEDSSGLTLTGLAVCDGVGGSDFYSYFAARILCLFAQKHLMDSYFDSNSVFGSRKKVLGYYWYESLFVDSDEPVSVERTVNAYYNEVFAKIVKNELSLLSFPILLHRALVYNFFISSNADLFDRINEFPLLRDLFTLNSPLKNVEAISRKILVGHATQNVIDDACQNIVKLVIEMEKLIRQYQKNETKNPYFAPVKIKHQKPSLFVDDNLSEGMMNAADATPLSVVFDQFQSMSSTLIMAQITPVSPQSDVNVLAVRQLGDSMLTIFKPKKLTDDINLIYTPVFFTFDSIADENTTPRQFNCPEQASFNRDRLEYSFTGSVMNIEEGDIVIAGSDGVFDNMPLSLMTILINAAAESFVAGDSKFLSSQTADSIIVNVLTEYFAATMYRSQDDINQLKQLKYLNFQFKNKEFKEDQFTSCSIDAETLSEFNLDQIFYVQHKQFNGYQESILFFLLA